MVLHIERAQLDELLERIPDTIDFDVDEVAVCRDLGQSLERTLRSELGLVHVAREADGRIPLPLGDNVVHVDQGADDAQFVTVSALLVADVVTSPALFEAINAINVQTPLAKTVLVDDRVVTSVALEVVDTLSPQDLLLAITSVGAVADEFGWRLQSRFGTPALHV